MIFFGASVYSGLYTVLLIFRLLFMLFSFKKPSDVFPHGFLSDLFPRAKPATLSREVIEAIRSHTELSISPILSGFVASKNRNAVDDKGRTVLHHAVVAGKSSLITFFLENGIDKEQEDNQGFTPLLFAVRKVSDLTPILRIKVKACIETLLLNNARVVSSGPFPHIAVNLAASSGDLDMLQLLEGYGAPLDDDKMGTALWWAEQAEEKSPEMIAYLQEKGCTARLGTKY